MSNIVHDLRPAWVKCARCGVTQPLKSLESVQAEWRCKDAKKCEADRLVLARELAEFELQHPLLFTRSGEGGK